MQKNEAGLTIGLKIDQLNWCRYLMSVLLNTLSLFWQTNPSLFQCCLGASVFTQVN